MCWFPVPLCPQLLCHTKSGACAHPLCSQAVVLPGKPHPFRGAGEMEYCLSWWQGKVPVGFLMHTSLLDGQRAHLPQLSPYKRALQTVQAHEGAVLAENRTQI